MILDTVWLIVGLLLILGGANFLTDGASCVAKKLGVSDLIIGLTVVAFGTSAPELAISIISAADGNTSIAIGNVVGSNIFNILAIIGFTALVRPIVIERSVMANEIPMLMLCGIILWVMASGSILNHDSIDIISRSDGIVLLIFFLLFMRYTFASARRTECDSNGSGNNDDPQKIPMWKAILCIVGGLAALVYGGDKFVDGASGIARGLGVSEAVIGLTIVAAGTSLPELATSIVAAVNNKPGMAVGNVIGSNIFNTLLVLGAASTVAPLPLGGITQFDLLTLAGAGVLFFICGWLIGKRTITRAEGALMAAAYIAYIAYQVAKV